MQRESFLARVADRCRLSPPTHDSVLPSPPADDNVPPRPFAPSPVDAARPWPSPSSSGREQLLARFAERARETGATVARASGREEARSAIVAMMRAKDANTIVCPPSMSWAKIADLRTDDPRCAQVGLSEADWGVAETGSVVLLHRGDRGRIPSLLPPIAGFVLPASRVVPRLGDVLSQLQEAVEPPPACITFVTGPSHSGDIAGVMCRGVHGPADVFVWLIEDE